MKRALLMMSVIGAAFSTCGPPVQQDCCMPIRAARNTVYSGTISGTGTEVKVELGSATNVTITFVRDGHQVTEGFTAVSINP